METIHEQIEQLMNDLTHTIERAIVEANERATSAKAIIDEQFLVLDEAADTLYTIGEGAERLSDSIGTVSEKAYAAAYTIEAMMEELGVEIEEEEPEAPSTDHTFEGYCKKCGKELYYDEYLVDTPAGRLCGDCHAYYIEHGTLDPVEEPWPVG